MAAEVDPDPISELRARSTTRTRRAQPMEQTRMLASNFVPYEQTDPSSLISYTYILFEPPPAKAVNRFGFGLTGFAS